MHFQPILVQWIQGIPNYGEVIGDALENNMHVEWLNLDNCSFYSQNVDKLVSFIEQNESLGCLILHCYTEINVTQCILLAIS